ncbi:hypothetical protein V9K67_05515 [Paraflavisolibacter sp. H34]|uniref:hypothetical protein n=1 Tax=Huijunlia imazamoxiresistens TaxID=3127457 RepID=UPI003015FCE2
MRTFVYISLPLLFLSCSDSENKRNGSNWMLSEQTIYTNTLTKEGYLDSSFAVRYRFNKGNLTDSSKGLIVRGYDKNHRLVRTEFFLPGKEGVRPRKAKGSSVFTYDAGGQLIASSSMFSGVLEEKSATQYDPSGRQVQLTNIFRVSEEAPEFQNAVFRESSGRKAAYDSVQVTFEYDKENKVSKVVTTDMRGKLLRTDFNLYSGSEAFASYSITPKGDTVQKIRYLKEGVVDKMVITAGSTVVTRWTSNDWLLGMVQEDNRTHKKRKLVNKYDETGKLVEQKVYLWESPLPGNGEKPRT